MLNRIARINDLRDCPEELAYLRATGYSGEHDCIYYDYIYKWSRMLKVCKDLSLLKNEITFLELGGGLSPVQFILSNHGCKVYNLDSEFQTAWFPTNGRHYIWKILDWYHSVSGKYYIGFTNASMGKNGRNNADIKHIQGNIFETIKAFAEKSEFNIWKALHWHHRANGKYYIGTTKAFMEESESNISNIKYVHGNIFETIKTIESNSIDAVIDTCSLHIFIGDGTNGILEEIYRVLKPGGYLISIGDVANPNLGRFDNEFKYPKDMADAISRNSGLKLIEPYDYDTWESELVDRENIIPRRNVDYNDLSLMNMKNDPGLIPYGNIPSYPIHLWTSTYILKKDSTTICKT